MVRDYSAVIGLFSFSRPSSRQGVWDVRCPCSHRHTNGDRRPSARVWIDEKTGDLRFWCAKGCRWQEAVECTNSRRGDWFQTSRDDGGSKPMAKTVATYSYVDLNGTLRYEVVRVEPKDFYQRRPFPGRPGQWIKSLSGGRHMLPGADGKLEEVYIEEVERILYRLPELVASGDSAILVVEGEGKVDMLRGLGFTATCCSGGASRWQLEYGKHFTGRRVVVFPDNDAPGRVFAATVAASAMLYDAASVRVVQKGMGWESLPPRGDIKDWLLAIAEGCPAEEVRSRQYEAVVDLVRMQPKWSAQ